MNFAATVAALFASNPRITLQELETFASDLDARAEDKFWAEVRKVTPTLCPEWTD